MRPNVPPLSQGNAKCSLVVRLTWTALILALIAGAAPLEASSEPAHAPTLFLLLMDRVGLEDITRGSLPSVRELAQFGGAGLLNARTGGGRDPGAPHVSLGAGERGVAGGSSGLAFDVGEIYAGQQAVDLYRALSGQDAADAAVIHLGVAELADLRRAQDRPFAPDRKSVV